jgi:rRNA maturation endonuclease Nob1
MKSIENHDDIWNTVQVGCSTNRKCKECNSVLEAYESKICSSCSSEVLNNRGVLRDEDYSLSRSYGRMPM